MNGSPVCLAGQAQIGLWFFVVHCAPMPQVFGQGSAHLVLTQARSGEHSELTIHSGRHCGGTPMYEGKHEHTACSLIFLH